MVVHWLFGRGASISCNLKWSVPPEWRFMPREEKICRIKNAILCEMTNDAIDTSPYRKLLSQLIDNASDSWQHRFITTNWDCLLEREIITLNFEVVPNWMASSHVYHINGTVEEYPNRDFGSPFLLEDDPYVQRHSTPEANIIFNYMILSRRFIVVGMSFECQMDRYLLESLNRVNEDLPIGKSLWLVLNPDIRALNSSSSNIKTALPHSTVYTKNIGFNEWLDQGMQTPWNI